MTLETCQLTHECIRELRCIVNSVQSEQEAYLPQLGGYLRKSLDRYAAQPCILVPLAKYFAAHEQRLIAAENIIRHIGTILEIYLQVRWHELEVRTEADPQRTHGTGENPLHIDFVSRSHPPECIGFLVDRPDPCGGGETLLADFAAALGKLGGHHRATLEMPSFRYWADQDVCEVGEVLSMFPMLESGNTQVARFTSKMLQHFENEDSIRFVYADADPDVSHRAHEALCAFRDILVQQTVSWPLAAGDLLIFNQRRIAHGRAALGPGQQAVPPGLRRHFSQIYFNL